MADEGETKFEHSVYVSLGRIEQKVDNLTLRFAERTSQVSLLSDRVDNIENKMSLITTLASAVGAAIALFATRIWDWFLS